MQNLNYKVGTFVNLNIRTKNLNQQDKKKVENIL